ACIGGRKPVSTPPSGTCPAGSERGRSSGVEHDLAKVGVEGSNPFARSNFLQAVEKGPSGSFSASRLRHDSRKSGGSRQRGTIADSRSPSARVSSSGHELLAGRVAIEAAGLDMSVRRIPI